MYVCLPVCMVYVVLVGFHQLDINLCPMGRRNLNWGDVSIRFPIGKSMGHLCS